jgi:hypothetical protein
MNNLELKLLQKSLRIISDFSNDINKIYSGIEFIKIHDRNIKMLLELGEERKTSFLKNAVLKYPIISVIEIEQFISKKKKDVSILQIVGGDIIGFFYGLIRTKGVSFSQIKNKMVKIKYINDKLYKVVEDSIYETLIEID